MKNQRRIILFDLIKRYAHAHAYDFELLDVCSHWSDEHNIVIWSANCRFDCTFDNSRNLYELRGFSPDYDEAMPFFYKSWQNINSINANQFPKILQIN